MPDPPEQPAWHQALAYAVTGRRLEELGRQAIPDIERLAEHLRSAGGTAEPGRAVVAVPDDLMRGLGAAQFHAALAELRRRLAPARTTAPVLADRPLTAEERRLVVDVPPHHGV